MYEKGAIQDDFSGFSESQKILKSLQIAFQNFSMPSREGWWGLLAANSVTGELIF